MAKEADTGTRTIEEAKAVAAKATPEVKEAVKAGKMSVKAGAATTRPAAEKPDAKPAPKGKPKGKPKAAKQQEAETNAAAANGDFDALSELERVQAELVHAQELLKVAEAVDLKAEAMKWRRAYDTAVRAQSEAMDRVHEAAKREGLIKRQLMRCGKAVGEEDEFKIAAVVEAMARKAKVAK